VFQVKLMKKILDLNANEIVQVQCATSWSFYFEAERFFEGTRSFMTAGRIEKPLLNAYRMLSLLGGERVAATSNAAWEIGALDETDGSSMPEEVDVLASREENGTVAALVWRHTDDQYQTSEQETPVALAVRNLPGKSYRVRHYRIDAEHSNAHTRWKELGEPQDPTDAELAQIKARQGLEELEPARTIDANEGRIDVEVTLPLPAASLLVLEPTD
jgi:xylan 1,4-beta-xylosidase